MLVTLKICCYPTMSQVKACTVVVCALQEQVNEWNNFVHGQTWQEYKESMARGGTFADELTVRVLADAIGHPLHILMSSPHGEELDQNVQIIAESC